MGAFRKSIANRKTSAHALVELEVLLLQLYARLAEVDREHARHSYQSCQAAVHHLRHQTAQAAVKWMVILYSL